MCLHNQQSSSCENPSSCGLSDWVVSPPNCDSFQGHAELHTKTKQYDCKYFNRNIILFCYFQLRLSTARDTHLENITVVQIYLLQFTRVGEFSRVRIKGNRLTEEGTCWFKNLAGSHERCVLSIQRIIHEVHGMVTANLHDCILTALPWV